MSTTQDLEVHEVSLSDRFTTRWDRFFATAPTVLGCVGGPDGEGDLRPPDVNEFLQGHPEAAPAERLAVLLVDQRERWRSGRERFVEDYLALPCAAVVAADPVLVRELALGELEARRASGQVGDLAAFLKRFPDLGPDLADQLAAGDIARFAETGSQTQRPTVVAGPPAGDLVRHDDGLLTPPDKRHRTTKPAHGDSTNRWLHDETFPAQQFPIDLVMPELGEGVRYAIYRKIGGGGMGVVYQAYDRRRGEIVALKTMRRVDPVALYRFKHEFRALTDLAHPNLVSLYELVAVGDLWFYTMEVVPGLDFVSHVRSGPVAGSEVAANPGTFTPDQAARLRPALRQLAEGVTALHDASKLHRDIKPPNLLVTPSGRVVLLDFGLTAELGRSGLHQVADDDDQVVGTVAYMAPEQAAGRPLSKASDWYSVGVVLYEALTGRLPFDGPPAEVLGNKQRHDPPAPAAVATGVPDDLNALCVELLARSSGARPSGRDVLARLESEEVGAAARDGQVVAGVSHVAPAPLPLADPAHSPAGAALIGRERHRDALWEAFETVRAGRTVLMLVSGRSGSGRSTLLESFLAELAEGDDAVVLAGRCYERESVPFKVLDSVIDALSRHLATLPDAEARRMLPPDTPLLARMFPVLRRVGAVARVPREESDTPDEQESRRRAVVALRELLTRIGRDRTLVMAIDDLQWGDGDNAALVEDLLRPPDSPVMLLLGSFRTEDADANPLLCALRSSTDAGDQAGPLRRELAVDALTFAESRELALAMLGRSDPAALAEAYLVARESRGNPFFIAELVKHVQSGAPLMSSDGELAAGTLELEDVIWSRIEHLPEGARRLLEVVAVSGRPVSLLDACQAADLGSGGRAAAAALRGARLIRGTGRPIREEVETYHDWVRETVMARLSAETVALHHLRLARVLETTGRGDAETLAAHYEGADRPDRAADYYAEAADRAADTLAFRHAAALYRRAIGLRDAGTVSDRDPARQTVMIGLYTRMGDALAAAGRGREAALAYREAAALPTVSAADAIELTRRVATQLLISGHVDEGLDVLRTLPGSLSKSPPDGRIGALASLALRRACVRFRPRGLRFTPRDESQVSAEARARIDLCWSAGAALSIIDPLRGADFHARGLLQALQAGEPYRVGRALALEACHTVLPGPTRVGRAEAIIARAEAIAREMGHPQLDAMVSLARVLVLLTAGHWRDACRELDLTERILRERCRGVAWELDTVHNFLLMAVSNLGELGTLRKLWPALMQEADDRGDLYALTTLGTIYMAQVRLADDEPDTAQADLDAVMARWPRVGYHIQHAGALRAQVAIDLYRGRADLAWQRVAEAWPAYRRSLLRRVHVIRVQLADLRGRAALAALAFAGDPRPLFAAAEQSARALEAERIGWADAHARMIRAGIAARRFQPVAAARLFRDAARKFDEADMALHSAIARRRASRFLEGAEAEALRAAADDDLDALGVCRVEPFVAVYAPDVIAESDTDPSTSEHNGNAPGS